MLKKAPFLFLAAIAVVALVYADPNRYEKLGPAIASNGNVVFSAPGQNRRNCITDLTSSSTNYIIIRALSGSTTIYAVHADTRTAVVEHWNSEAPLCADWNTTLAIRTQNGTVGGGLLIEPSGVISYSGYIYEPGK